MSVDVGDVLDEKYKLTRLIGAGGMGRVYEAIHLGLGTGVAIKCLLPHLARVPTLAERFLREARIAAQLANPYVARVYDVSQLPDGTPYLVMELLRGELLQARLDRLGRLVKQDALEVATQILRGLEAAHAIGVVHRDLKPENVFLTRETGSEDEIHVKLLDFGIAKVKLSDEYQVLTKPGTALGTPEYMAPEQAYSADQATERSDLYSVAVMVYEMLSGRLPAEGETPLEIANKIISGPIDSLQSLDPALPEALCELVMRTMSPNPDERPPSARELRQALEPWRAGGTTRTSTQPGHGSPSQLGVSAVAVAPAPGRRPAVVRARAPIATAVEEDLDLDEPPPMPSAPPQPDLSAADPFPATEQMSAVSVAAVRQGRMGAGFQSPAAGMPGGGVAPTAPDPLAHEPINPTAGPRRRSALVGLAVIGLALGGAVAAYLYVVAASPGDPPPPPALPEAR